MPLFTLSHAERQIYHKYAKLSLPRHTSYPIAPEWTKEVGHKELIPRLESLFSRHEPLSLYLHIPYCEKLCFYCACNKEIVPVSATHGLGEQYLLNLTREFRLITALSSKRPVLAEIHLGGGTPTFLTPAHLLKLHDLLTEFFDIMPHAQKSIEVDPRVTHAEKVDILCDLGFSRFSLGVQDFSLRVQEAINRVQPSAMVERLVSQLRARGIQSIYFDLIYGLPYQTEQSLEETLALTLELSPDRIAFYRLALIPQIFRWQKSFTQKDLPEGDLILDLFLNAVSQFTKAGYEFIGLDHFAKPDEKLSRALQDKTLQRNFQGMTTGKNLPLLSFGPSAITQLDDLYLQNEKETKVWASHLQENRLPHDRGFVLNTNHQIRREVIQSFYSYQGIDISSLESKFKIDFWTYFAQERNGLEELASDGLCVIEADSIFLTPVLGRLLVRVVSSVFDDFLPREAYKTGVAPTLASKVG